MLNNNTVDIGQYIAYSCVIGSRAYGLNRPDSDTDRRGFYILPPEILWSPLCAQKLKEQREFRQQYIAWQHKPDKPDDRDATYWEIGKFMHLLYLANPNVLECLYTPMVEVTCPMVQILINNRHRFLSKHLIKTYGGYARQQFEKLRANPEACEELGLTPKHYNNPGCKQGTRDIALSRRNAMHMVRMMLGGISALKEYTIMVDVSEHREALLNIRTGQMSLKDALAWFNELDAEFNTLKDTTKLPDVADLEWMHKYLLSVRTAMASNYIEQGILLSTEEMLFRNPRDKHGLQLLERPGFTEWYTKVYEPYTGIEMPYKDEVASVQG